MAAKKDKDAGVKIAADNRKARHNYFIEDVVEAGIMLTGTEVKSLRGGKATIGESYAHPKDGEIFLVNSYIPEYTEGNRFNHEPRRVRKLLLRRNQIAKLSAAVEREGMTLVPLKIIFNAKGRAKVELGLAKGKKLHDKRDTEKKRDWEREKGRLMREKG
jgi:SsrA-binding protein